MTHAFVHNIRVVHDLIEGCRQSVILADLGYLNHKLKADLARTGYDLWTPLCQNMIGAKEHHHWKLMAMRHTFETRFSELVWLFDSEHKLARRMTGLPLRLEQIVLAYNLRLSEIN